MSRRASAAGTWTFEGAQAEALSPCIDDEAVYWASAGEIHRLAASTGRVAWSHDEGDEVRALALVGEHVVAAIGSVAAPRLAWLRRRDGARVHQRPMPGAVMALASDGERLAAITLRELRRAQSTMDVVSVDAARAEVRFRVPLEAPGTSILPIGDRTLARTPRGVEAFDAAGTRAWSFVAPFAMLATDAVLAIDARGRLSCLDPSTGACRWAVELPIALGPRAQPAVDAELVVLVDPSRGLVSALELATGTTRWSTTFEPGDDASCRAWPHPRGVLLTDGEGRLLRLARANGRIEGGYDVRVARGLDLAAASATHVALVHSGRLGQALRTVDLGRAALVPLAAAASEAPSPTSLAARMRAWVELFASRADVRVTHASSAPGRPGFARVAHAPPDVRAFATETLVLRSAWTLAGEDPPVGGHVWLDFAALLDSPLRVVRSARRLGDVAHAAWAFDRAIDESPGLLFRAPRAAHASVAFAHTSRDALVPFESFEAYLTAGARAAFAPYWQIDSAESRDVRARLRARSVEPSLGPAALAERLIGRGASRAMADALVAWLGDDVVLLLPA